MFLYCLQLLYSIFSYLVFCALKNIYLSIVSIYCILVDAWNSSCVEFSLLFKYIFKTYYYLFPGKTAMQYAILTLVCFGGLDFSHLICFIKPGDRFQSLIIPNSPLIPPPVETFFIYVHWRWKWQKTKASDIS